MLNFFINVLNVIRIVASIWLVIQVIDILRYLFPRPYLVVGNSMYPTLKEDMIVLGQKVHKKDDLENGAIYIHRVPDDPKRWVIKRLSYHYATGESCFLGDNSEDSRDSRSYGLVNKDLIMSKVIYYKGKQRGERNGKSRR